MNQLYQYLDQIHEGEKPEWINLKVLLQDFDEIDQNERLDLKFLHFHTEIYCPKSGRYQKQYVEINTKYIAGFPKPFYLIEYLLSSKIIDIFWCEITATDIDYEGLKNYELYIKLFQDYRRQQSISDSFIKHYEFIEDWNHEFFWILQKYPIWFERYQEIYDFDVRKIISELKYEKKAPATFEDIRKHLSFENEIKDKDVIDTIMNLRLNILHYPIAYVFDFATVEQQIILKHRINIDYYNYLRGICQFSSTTLFEIFEDEITEKFEDLLKYFNYSIDPSFEFVEMMIKKFDFDLIMLFLLCCKSSVLIFYLDDINEQFILNTRKKYSEKLINY